MEENKFQPKLPKKEPKDSDCWKLEGNTGTHNLNGAKGNKDYRGLGKNKGKQAIYDENGNLVTSPENEGTFDFFSPTDNVIEHFIYDVNPWIAWGNSPNDKTTTWERSGATIRTLTERVERPIKKLKKKFKEEGNRIKDYIKDYFK